MPLLSIEHIKQKLFRTFRHSWFLALSDFQNQHAPSTKDQHWNLEFPGSQLMSDFQCVFYIFCLVFLAFGVGQAAPYGGGQEGAWPLWSRRSSTSRRRWSATWSTRKTFLPKFVQYEVYSTYSSLQRFLFSIHVNKSFDRLSPTVLFLHWCRLHRDPRTNKNLHHRKNFLRTKHFIKF